MKTPTLASQAAHLIDEPALGESEFSIQLHIATSRSARLYIVFDRDDAADAINLIRVLSQHSQVALEPAMWAVTEIDPFTKLDA